MLYIDSCNFTKKENSHICEVEIQTMQKYAILATLLKKRELFCQKSFRNWAGGVHTAYMGKFSVWLPSSHFLQPRPPQPCCGLVFFFFFMLSPVNMALACVADVQSCGCGALTRFTPSPSPSDAYHGG